MFPLGTANEQSDCKRTESFASRLRFDSVKARSNSTRNINKQIQAQILGSFAEHKPAEGSSWLTSQDFSRFFMLITTISISISILIPDAEFL